MERGAGTGWKSGREVTRCPWLMVQGWACGVTVHREEEEVWGTHRAGEAGGVCRVPGVCAGAVLCLCAAQGGGVFTRVHRSSAGSLGKHLWIREEGHCQVGLCVCHRGVWLGTAPVLAWLCSGTSCTLALPG